MLDDDVGSHVTHTSCFIHLVQNSSDGAGGRQERRAGPTAEIPSEATDGHPADPAP